jgi:signal transduction histidine kinase/DNA-binding response OmpR family regulator
MVLIVGGATPLLLGWFILLGDPSNPGAWSPPLAFLAACYASLLVARRKSTAGAALLVLVLAFANTFYFWTRGTPSSPFFFAAVVFAGGTLLGPYASTGIGIFSVLEIVLGEMRTPGSFGLPAAVFIGVAVVLSWAASHPVYAALSWAWNSYDDSLKRTEELRDRQGELNRVLASLNETVYRLEVANQELARARTAAEEARQLKSEFAANISHELRTPLNLIIGFSEILMTVPNGHKGALVSPEARADVDVIHRNARHLSNLIDDVLDLSQVDAGRMGLTKERVTLASIVDEAIAAVERLFDVRGLALRTESMEDLPALFVDRTRIRQVLINLLNNASRFTQTGGVTISAIQDGASVTVRVADTGVGIAAEDIPKIFEEFRQLDGSMRRPHDGSGLGLAICRRFVEMHGGTIWAESEPGRGTVFSFSLPLIENVASATMRAEWDTWVRQPPPSNEDGRSVVLINQDPRVERLFRRYLDGYRILPAVDEVDALRLFGHNYIHGVVLIASPNAPLPEALRRLREAPRSVPVVVCSLPSNVSMGENLGVSDYLVKPISGERLLGTLLRIGGKARTVMVVDDDPEMVRLLARMIRSRSHRFNVVRAYGGEAALALLDERRPDLVILDLVMPGIDGYAVIRAMRAREELRDIPVVAITARSNETEVVSAGAIEITREGGLSLRELMGCVKSSLDSITGTGDNVEAPTPDLRP